MLGFAESGNVEDEAACRSFQKFIKHQAEFEYKSKLDKLKQIKDQHGGKSSPGRAKLRKKLG